MADANKTVKLVISGEDQGITALLNKTEKGFQGLQNELLSFRGALASLGITAVIAEAVQAANQLEKSNVGLAVTARYSGAGMEAAMAAAKSLSKDGLMSVTEASQALQNLLSRGYGLEESISLMNRFKDSAAFNRQAHLGFGESIVGATEGLKNENSVLVDNAGVTKNVSVMWKEYALAHGKTAESLSQSEKRQAEYNGILKETEGQAGNAARMTDTFAGAQSRLNAQMFDAKAALGVGLQPMLQGVLTIMGPVVNGFRDIVYWIQIMGLEAGRVWAKVQSMASNSVNGKGMFSKEGLAAYKDDVRQFDTYFEQELASIISRANGTSLPDIGKDSGKRRQDTKLPDPKAISQGESWQKKRIEIKAQIAEAQADVNDYTKAVIEVNKKADELLKEYDKLPAARSLIEAQRSAQLAAIDRNIQKEVYLDNFQHEMSDIKIRDEAAKEQYLEYFEGYLESLRLAKENAVNDAGQGTSFLNAIGKMDTGQEQQFDASAMLSTRSAMLLAMNEQDLQMSEEFNAMRAQLNGDSTQIELLRLKQETDAKIQSWAMQTDSEVEYNRRRTLILADSEQKRQGIIQSSEARQMQIRMTSAANALSFTQNALNAMASFTDGKSKVMFAVTKAVAVAQAIVAAHLASAQALASPPGPPYTIPLAASVLGWGYANAALTAAVAIGQGVSGNGAPWSGSASPSGNSSSPVVTQPLPQTQQQGNMTVNIHGPIIGEDRWVEENLVPALNAAGSRSIKIEYMN